MSTWTHVNAQIRLDSIELITGPIQNDLENIIGPTYLPFYEEHDIIKDWPNVSYEKESKVKLPVGSEGSLRVEVIRNKDDHAVASHVISIYGDLRDFDSYKDIENWWYKLCKDLENKDICRAVGIRQAMCQVEVEGAQPEQMIFFKDKSNIQINEDE